MVHLMPLLGVATCGQNFERVLILTGTEWCGGSVLLDMDCNCFAAVEWMMSTGQTLKRVGVGATTKKDEEENCSEKITTICQRTNHSKLVLNSKV